MINVSERERFEKMCFLERSLRQKGYRKIAGVDEVGRGSLAGPVVAASCILLKEDFFLKGLDDSKKLTEKKREDLYFKLLEDENVVFATSFISEKIIDKKNILNATFLAMKTSLFKLRIKPDFVLIDGNQSFFLEGIEKKTVIKGDSLSVSIAAASIIAKKERDDFMKNIHKKHPHYGFLENKGYGTKKHKNAIFKYGPSSFHRTSFEPVKSLFFSEQYRLF